MAHTSRLHRAASQIRSLSAAALSLLWAALTPSAAGAADLGSQLATRAAEALESNVQAVRTGTVTQPGWTWLQLEVRDETYPLTVHIVGNSKVPATKVVYLLPGGSTNFEGSFFTPHERNLSQFMGEKGYLVVSVNPREDNVPTTLASYRFMESWGLEKHSTDVRSIVTPIQKALGLPYEVLGHSYGAASALDYAARYAAELAPERVIALDIYSLDVVADTAAQDKARRTYEAHAQLMRRGEYVDTTYGQIKPVAALVKATPALDSGQSRADFGQPGSFTLEGLMFSSLIDGAGVAGIHTPITNLPGDWLLNKSVVAGQYAFADDPRNDRYAFTRSSYADFIAGIEATGSGLVPVAFERDFWAVTAGDPAYRLDWSAIKEKLVWLNSEYGYGAHRYGAKLVRDAGNAQVVDAQVDGYGHADMIAGETARFDVWERFVQ